MEIGVATSDGDRKKKFKYKFKINLAPNSLVDFRWSSLFRCVFLSFLCEELYNGVEFDFVV